MNFKYSGPIVICYTCAGHCTDLSIMMEHKDKENKYFCSDICKRFIGAHGNETHENTRRRWDYKEASNSAFSQFLGTPQ